MTQKSIKERVIVFVVSLLAFGCVFSHDESDSQKANSYVEKGEKYFENGEYGRAVDAFNKAISLDSSKSKPYAYLIISEIKRDSLDYLFNIYHLSNDEESEFFKLSLSQQNDVYQKLLKLEVVARMYYDVLESEEFNENTNIVNTDLAWLATMIKSAKILDTNNDKVIDNRD